MFGGTEAGAGRVTRLLRRWRDGDTDALDRLLPLVYDDLRRIARRHLGGERPGHTLNTTALVNESYLNLVSGEGPDGRDRAQFFALASRVMRNVLVDYARRRRARKRGGDRVRITLEPGLASVEPPVDDLLALDEALEWLGERNGRLARVVECRFFGGMTVAETAEALEVSTRTVERDWARARAHLHRFLEGGAEEDPEGSGPAAGEGERRGNQRARGLERGGTDAP